jgi:hypothetical protein
VPKPRPWWSESSFKIQEAIIAVGEAIDDEADPDDPEAADVELMIQELREAVDAFERLANAKRAGIQPGLTIGVVKADGTETEVS